MPGRRQRQRLAPTPARGAGGGRQPPLLNTVVNRDTDPPSPPAPAREVDDLIDTLRQEGVRVARVIVRDFDADRITAALEAYREVEDAGPGLLVWMIREGCQPRQEKRDEQEDAWLRRRMEVHLQRQEEAS